jgi:ferric hydroxamate transport system substrate-binding protein
MLTDDSRTIGRRALLKTLCASSIAACTPSRHGPMRGGGIAALDWALAETLIALGHPPQGVVAAADWASFVVEPALPAGIADLGLQQELNFELISMLQPDLILISPFLDYLETTLIEIAPTLNLSVYQTASVPLSNRMRITRELAARLGDPQAAERLIESLAAARVQARAELAGLPGQKPLVFASFIDNRHARVYGGSSLYADVLAWLGIENGWPAPVGDFGFSTIGIEELAGLRDVELIAVAPVPPHIADGLAKSPLWTELPFVKAGNHGVIEPIFMFGALPSAARMLKLLVPYLRGRWR